MRKQAESKDDQSNCSLRRTRQGGFCSPTRRSQKGRPQTGAVLGCGKPDRALLSSAIREWIVPLLVRDFLAEHRIAVHATEANSNKPTSGVLGEEGAGSIRMNPNGH